MLIYLANAHEFTLTDQCIIFLKVIIINTKVILQ